MRRPAVGASRRRQAGRAVAVTGAGPAVIVAGLVAGGAEWVDRGRTRGSAGSARGCRPPGAEQGGFGLHFALLDELRALNGPDAVPAVHGRGPVPRSSTCGGSLLPVLVGLGLLAARRLAGFRWLAAWLLPAVCGLCVAAQYLFMIDYAAPRFLLPAYALLAVPAADGLAFLLTAFGPELRPADDRDRDLPCSSSSSLAQHLVLDHEAGGTVHVPRRLHADRGRAGRPRRPAAVPDPGGAVHPDRLLRGLRVGRARDAGRSRRGARPGRSAGRRRLRQELARLPHHRHQVLKVNAYIRVTRASRMHASGRRDAVRNGACGADRGYTWVSGHGAP